MLEHLDHVVAWPKPQKVQCRLHGLRSGATETRTDNLQRHPEISHYLVFASWTARHATIRDAFPICIGRTDQAVDRMRNGFPDLKAFLSRQSSHDN
jgi:hypothetical protein